VNCPKCGHPSTFADRENGQAEPPRSRRRWATEWRPVVAGLALSMLAWCAVQQSLILKELQYQRRIAGEPKEVVVTEPVSIETSYGNAIAVEISDVVYGTVIPVEIERITTSDQLPVEIEAHTLYGAEPIPVTVQ